MTAIHDLSAIFAAGQRPMYLDAFHLTETGNELVARAMTTTVGDVLSTAPRSR